MPRKRSSAWNRSLRNWLPWSCRRASPVAVTPSSTQGIEGFAAQDTQHHVGLPPRGPATTLGGRLRPGAGAVHGHLLGQHAPKLLSMKTVGRRGLHVAAGLLIRQPPCPVPP